MPSLSPLSSHEPIPFISEEYLGEERWGGGPLIERGAYTLSSGEKGGGLIRGRGLI